MSKKKTFNTLTIVGTAFAAGLAASNVAMAKDAGANPFAMNELSSGYMQVAQEGKCGDTKKSAQEGKCGANKSVKEGKCGGTMKEGKCGAPMMGSTSGEAAKKTKKEGKCGEGKCGANKNK